MKVRDIYNIMEEFAPFERAEEFDNCGLIIGGPDMEITKIGLALDITNQIIDEAIEQGINLIVTHHPVIFNPIKRIREGTPVYRLIQNGIAHIAAHTNLDKTDGGVNTVLAKYYHLKNVGSPLRLRDLGRIGELKEEMSVKEYAELIKKELNSGSVRYYDSGRPVKNVAYISGGGGSQFNDVLNCGVDTFITGDLKHDQFVEAQNRGLNLIEANHFDSENTVMIPLGDRLRKAFPAMEIILLSRENAVKTV